MATGQGGRRKRVTSDRDTQTAILAGGCFWCLEAVFVELDGVLEVKSGYIGGRRPNPTYEQVCTGTTGHAEAVRVEYDPAIITYDDLLDVFFSIHDPTTLNRQGHDVGSQYRSAIFPLDDDQERRAREALQRVSDQRIYDAPLVTALEQATEFYPAEQYHDDYFARNPNQPYCAAVIAPKVAKFRKQHLERLRRPQPQL